MIRRRLQLSYSSDEEDEAPPQQPQPSTAPQPPVTQARPSPYPSGPLPISSSSDDEEFIDVADNLSPPSPEFPESHNVPPPPPSSGGCPIGEFLQGLGLRLKQEWLDGCVLGLQQSVPGFRNLDSVAKAKLCFEQFLVSDMNLSGGGVLPQNVASLHQADLPGPYVLQVDEIVNMSNPLKIRYQKASAGHKRCLKLSMTDGVQRVFGMEYRPIQALEALAPAGFKVVVCNVHIRRGLLMLVPQSLEVLGGFVDELDAAQKRLVEEVNKPPRGNRTRNGSVPPLANRAALAAWPPDGVHVAGQANPSTLEAPTPLQASNRGAGRNSMPITTQETVPRRTEPAVYRPSPRIEEDMPMDSIPNSGENVVSNPSSYDFGVQRLNINTFPYTSGNTMPNTAIADPPNLPYEDALDIEEDIDMDAASISSETHGPRPSTLDDYDVHLVNEAEAFPSSDAIMNAEDTDVMNEMEHPLLLLREREPPFVYLSSLSLRLGTSNIQSVRGKVKCVLTGVKSFQYKQKYDLRAYIDDGGMISEILIDHDVVQNRIGHSPEDVKACLSSPDKAIVSKMKANMKQLQVFLADFEGIMLIEMSRGSDFPVALEMNQGCPSSEAWLLLRRLKGSPPTQASESHSSRLAQASQGLSSCPIDISP
ncbi:recQ-mediated genome instability protein 1 [Argentina anserina]|uniref:recQ-mediated genome instability protein 1 n=1 Tax=Argentina anserina TaxID=57926 RepID=UPI0021765973|nr:recQ-mediated genome instability protein 1 [Potentilla anserina]